MLYNYPALSTYKKNIQGIIEIENSITRKLEKKNPSSRWDWTENNQAFFNSVFNHSYFNYFWAKSRNTLI